MVLIRQYLQQHLSYVLTLSLSLSAFSGCVVKEELNDTYNQAHLGLNQWELKPSEEGGYMFSFDAGYLLGLVDDAGIEAIRWSYKLITRDQELLGSFEEEMREPSPEKTQIFVEGRRSRSLEIPPLLTEGETYVVWFTLYYKEEILHEQLFPVVAGAEGGDPRWIEELIGERLGEEELNSLGLGSGMSAGSDEPLDMVPDI